VEGSHIFFIGPRLEFGAFVDNPDRGIMVHGA